MEGWVYWADVLTGIGLFLTAVGAGYTAWAVILTEDDAIAIGVPRYASKDRAKNLEQPAVKNLLKSSRHARIGLWIVVAGTAFQLGPIIVRVALPLFQWIS